MVRSSGALLLRLQALRQAAREKQAVQDPLIFDEHAVWRADGKLGTVKSDPAGAVVDDGTE